jgi:hypothetical protein
MAAVTTTAPPLPSTRPAGTQIRRIPAGFNDVGLRLLVAGAAIAVVLVGVLMFTTPHATFDGYVNSDNGGIGTAPVTWSCVSAWNDLVGNYPVNAPGGYYYNQNLKAAGSACGGVVRGREHLATLFLVVAVGCGISAAIRYRIVARRGRTYDWDSLRLA